MGNTLENRKGEISFLLLLLLVACTTTNRIYGLMRFENMNHAERVYGNVLDFVFMHGIIFRFYRNIKSIFTEREEEKKLFLDCSSSDLPAVYSFSFENERAQLIIHENDDESHHVHKQQPSNSKLPSSRSVRGKEFALCP